MAHRDLIYSNIMDRWKPFLWNLKTGNVEKVKMLAVFHIWEISTGAHTQKNSFHQLRKTSFPNEAVTKAIIPQTNKIFALLTGHEFLSPSQIHHEQPQTDGEVQSPSTLLSDCHFLSLSPFIPLPPFQRLSLSVHPSLHHPLCTSSPGYCRRGRCLFTCMLPSLAPT